jgi:protein-tyrosine kinase
LDLDPERLSGSGIVSVDGSDPAAEVFDMLRTQVYRRLQQNKWTSVAVVSPRAGCGSSLVATNLAFGLARQDDCRVLLVDLNLRQPQLAALMGIDNPFELEQTLQNEAPLDASVLRCGSNLALLAYNGAVKHPAELLQSVRIAEALTTLRQRLAPDVILYDMAPLRPHDDSLAFLPQADCALLVLEAEKTTAEQADLCAFEITQATSMLGVVLNKCRFPADPLLVGSKA